MYQPILGTLGYILSPDQKKVLMIHRNKKKGDCFLGKYNGLGGKLDSGEHIMEGMRREIREEAGIECLEMTLRGSINWPGFNDQNWLGFIFLITKFSGAVQTENEEGTLVWLDKDSLHDYPMWEGDRFFLPLVFDEDPRPFHGLMPYAQGRPVSWSYSR